MLVLYCTVLSCPRPWGLSPPGAWNKVCSWFCWFMLLIHITLGFLRCLHIYSPCNCSTTLNVMRHCLQKAAVFEEWKCLRFPAWLTLSWSLATFVFLHIVTITRTHASPLTGIWWLPKHFYILQQLSQLWTKVGTIWATAYKIALILYRIWIVFAQNLVFIVQNQKRWRFFSCQKIK